MCVSLSRQFLHSFIEIFIFLRQWCRKDFGVISLSLSLSHCVCVCVLLSPGNFSAQFHRNFHLSSHILCRKDLVVYLIMACFGLAAAAMVAMVSVRRNGDLKKEKGKVMVGTKNQGKIDALTSTLKRWRYGEDAEVRGVKVQSGVREQPYGIEETKDGAMNRAKRAFDSCENAIFGVGLESGVLESKDGNLYDFLRVLNL